MSRPEISNIHHLRALIAQLRARSGRDGHRGILLIRDLTPEQQALLASQIDAPYLPSTSTADRADRVTALLGSEFDMLVHELREPCDAGLLAALAGTIRAAGLLILCMAPATSRNPEHTQPSPSGIFTRRFEKRLLRLLAESARCHPQKVMMVSATAANTWADSCPTSPVDGTNPAPVIAPECTPETGQPMIAARREQDDLLTRALSHLGLPGHRCVIVHGRRGRGKSALLGRLAAGLQQEDRRVVVTAARRSAMASASRQASGLDHVAPDAVSSLHADVLLVEEAASLPLKRLQEYLDNWPKIVLCTTLEGYEQAGRALDIRLDRLLDSSGHEPLLLQPRHPWRWCHGDPLEAWVDELMLCSPGTGRPVTALRTPSEKLPQNGPDLSARTRNLERLPLPPDGDITLLRRLDREALARDDRRLFEVFSLLRDTHYQTRNTDLQHLLDAPNVQIWTLESEHLLAASVVAMEGEIDEQLHQSILRRERRLPDQLLPQLLAQFIDEPHPLSCRIARILRIAVPPAHRRQRLASRLLQGLQPALQAAHPSLRGIGASFAGDEANLAFWQSNGFIRFHRGYRRNPRTGTSAVAVLHTQDARLRDLLMLARHLDDDNQRHRAARPGQAIDAAGKLDTTVPVDTRELDGRLLERFIAGQRHVADTTAALARLLERPLIAVAPGAGVSRRQHEAELRQRAAQCLQSRLRSSN